MGVLGNPEHERFCKLLHERTWAGESLKAASIAAYREAIYSGAKVDDVAIEANARRLRNLKHVKARRQEMAEFSAKLAGVDAAWGMVTLKGLVEANLDDYLTPANGEGDRFFDLGTVDRDKLGRLAEVTLEDHTEFPRGEAAEETARRIRKTKLRLHDRIQALALMAKIGGWESPKKIEAEVRVDPLKELLDEINGTTRGLPKAEDASPP